ncbi:VanZ family protein [Flavobacterium sp. PL12]|uniref:VanZ family protein n=1 Tax=Flavobacterium sp. PL12 TaxID=3071718 RepID=UPI00319E5E70
MHKNLYFWAALIWSGVIAFFCLAQFESVPLGDVTNIDKLVHAFFHFVLTTLSFLFFRSKLVSKSSITPLLFSFFFSVLFGIGIEVAQNLMTTTRQADVYDVLANMTGATLSLLLIILFGLNKKSR